MPLDKSIKKVLVIGSGPIVIGQAAEFDYAGAQACRVLKSRGIDVVLLNSNPATIMTDKALANEIYLEPLTLTTVKRIIEKEKPDSILATLGGQTGLTLAMQLYKEGFFETHNVRLLGTDAEAIIKAEDRELFKDTMLKIGQPLIPSDIAETLDEAKEIATRIGYPVIIRPAFTLGGFGGGVADNEEELCEVAANGLEQSPITQILVEKYIYGWKEIEFEVIRDHKGNHLAVCSMENVDPVGVHTGDSIVVAPAMTLAAEEYNMLRTASLDIIDELGIEGGCNCQFALDPVSKQYAVIEVNPRVSRSSALASKATGYPIAKVSVQIALGYTLDEIKNEVTGKTFACFEPTVDYVVLKMPKWPFDKFAQSTRLLGTQMKATGEVMSIAPSFEEALMKAVRGAEISQDTLNCKLDLLGDDPYAALGRNDDRRLFRIFAALKAGISIDDIYTITKIDKFFLSKLAALADFEKELATVKNIGEELYTKAKKLGYTDEAISRISGIDSLPAHRATCYKMVDTCGGEFMAERPYFYGTHDDISGDETKPFMNPDKKTVVVLGSGPIRIGQGIEFDYSSVHCVWALKDMGYDVAIINNNPETVSTDFDIADRLYFEPLTPEDVWDILQLEKPIGVVVAFGGQTAIKLTGFLDKMGVPVLGTSADGIDLAEDRARFDALLESMNIRRPSGMGVSTLEEALNAGATLGYPVLLRPSYVIGGQNMVIAHEPADVEKYMNKILSTGIDNPVLVDKYMMGTELEVDVISDGKDVLIPGIMEHIERAGVHSGDSIAVYPPYNLTDKMRETLCECSTKLALSLGTKGLVNIQYLIYENELYVIEVNPRASRTIPYISKVTGVPMVDIASQVMVGKPLRELRYGTGLYKVPPYWAVKVPVFSFEKLSDVNTQLGPEMKSTGEVLGVGKTLDEAIFKGFVSAGFNLKTPTAANDVGVFISVEDHDYFEIVGLAKKLDDLGMKLYATSGTAAAISQLGIDVEVVANLTDDAHALLESGKVGYIVYTGALLDDTINEFIALHRKAIQLSIATLTSLDTANAMADVIASRYSQYNTELVDLNHMRRDRMTLHFAKMQTLGNDYIYLDNLDGESQISCPESLALKLCDRNYGIGGDGIVFIERSNHYDAKMRIFNRDGSEGRVAGNPLRCVAKYLYDKGLVDDTDMVIDTWSGPRTAHAILAGGEVGSVTVDMGDYTLDPAQLPTTLSADQMIDGSINIGGDTCRMTCVGIGNPHAVVFVGNVDAVNVGTVGPEIENLPIFPERTNVEFIRIVNRTTIKMRVWERGNGETLACGSGACAAAVAAVVNGLCDTDKDITVKLRGGDLLVRVSDNHVSLTGDAKMVFEGTTVI
ncbi:MAG: carbamoyl-phosphate synthase large subunit [Clostridia bacterium]|nr:carbamoyl-phosphate synthase large subunit [Clostridia bacterium]